MADKLTEGEIDIMFQTANEVFQQVGGMIENAKRTHPELITGVRISYLDIDGTEKYLWIEQEEPDD